MSRAHGAGGRQVVPGIWQTNTKNEWVIRTQPLDPTTGRRKNIRRVLQGVSLVEAISARDELLRKFLARVAMTEVTVATPPSAPVPVVTTVTAPASSTNSPSTSPVTVRTFARSWLERKLARGDITDVTHRRYATALDRMSAAILDSPIGSLDAETIEAWQLASRRKYDPETVNGWHRVLSSMLNDAMRRIGLLRNVALDVPLLRKKVDLVDTNSATPAELGAILVALRESADWVVANAAHLQAETGTRWQEVSALCLEDVDLTAGIITIRRKVVQGGHVVPRTKTDRGRVVGLSAGTVARLESYMARLEREHPSRGSPLLFPSTAGTPLASGRVSDVLREARARAGITRRLTSQGLRRSMTDFLRLARVDPVTAQALIGHQTTRMRDHYSTVRPEEARDAAERVATLLSDAAPGSASSKRSHAGSSGAPSATSA